MARKFRVTRNAGPSIPCGMMMKLSASALPKPPPRHRLDAELLPGADLARPLSADQRTIEVRRQSHFPAPRVGRRPACLGQVVGRRGESIVFRVPQIARPVSRPVDRVGEVGGGNELGMSHGACPRAGEPVGGDDPALQDPESGDDLGLRIGAPPAVVCQGSERAHHSHRALVLAEIAFHAPDRHQDMPVDSVFALEGGEKSGLLGELALPRFDAGRRHRLAQILRGGGSELGLVAGELEDFRIGLVHSPESQVEGGRG